MKKLISTILLLISCNIAHSKEKTTALSDDAHGLVPYSTEISNGNHDKKFKNYGYYELEIINSHDQDFSPIREENYRNYDLFTTVSIGSYHINESNNYIEYNLHEGYKGITGNGINYYIGYNSEVTYNYNNTNPDAAALNHRLYSAIEANNIAASYLFKYSKCDDTAYKTHMFLLEYKKQFSDKFITSPYISFSSYSDDSSKKYQFGFYNTYKVNDNFALSVDTGVEHIKENAFDKSLIKTYYAHTKLRLGREDSSFKVLINFDGSWLDFNTGETKPIKFSGAGIKLQYSI